MHAGSVRAQRAIVFKVIARQSTHDEIEGSVLAQCLVIDSARVPQLPRFRMTHHRHDFGKVVVLAGGVRVDGNS